MRRALLLLLLLAAPSPSAQGGDGAAAVDAVPTPQGDAAPVREGYCVVLPDEPVDPAISAEWNGRRVSFCCPMCRKQFLADPQRFASRLSPLASPAGATPQSVGDGSAEPSAGADEAGRPASWWAFLGRLHPLVVHFPITLLFLAGVAEALVRPGDTRWRGRARFLLALGAPAAAVAAWLGWLAAEGARFPTLEGVLLRHRWLGVATAAVALLAIVVAPRARTVDLRRDRLYRWLVFAAVVLVVVAGHHGGTLVFGPDHFQLPR